MALKEKLNLMNEIDKRNDERITEYLKERNACRD